MSGDPERPEYPGYDPNSPPLIDPAELDGLMKNRFVSGRPNSLLLLQGLIFVGPGPRSGIQQVIPENENVFVSPSHTSGVEVFSEDENVFVVWGEGVRQF